MKHKASASGSPEHSPRETCASSTVNGEGEAIHANGEAETIGRDFTERAEIEEALKESEERSGRSCSTRATSWRSPTRTTFRYASPAVERIPGCTPRELVGTVVADLRHPEEDRAGDAKIAEVLLIPGAQDLGTWRYRQKDGSYRWLEVVANDKLHDPALRRGVCNCRDVTERIEAEERLRRSEERRRALNENVLDFVLIQSADNTVSSYASPSR